MSGAAVVTVEGLVVRRGQHTVLDGLDLEVGPGVTGLLGPSGCGKSTLLRALVGVQRTHGGSVTVLDHPAGAAAVRARVGYVTQAASVYDDLTVSENLRFFARVLDVPGDRVDRVLAEVDLADRAGDVVGRLSGGQRSRVSLAVALLRRPDGPADEAERRVMAGAIMGGLILTAQDTPLPEAAMDRALSILDSRLS